MTPSRVHSDGCCTSIPEGTGERKDAFVNRGPAAPPVSVIFGPMAATATKADARLATVPDSNTSDAPSEDASGRAGRTTAGTGRARFPLVRWVLAPRTTWQARRLAADFGEGMDARTAWVMARLARHPDERGYAMGHLEDDRHRPG